MRARAFTLAVVVALGLLTGAGAPASAGPACSGVDRELIAYAKEQLTIDNTVKTLTQATINTGNHVPAAALVSVTTNSIMVLDTGDDPSTTVGVKWDAGDKFYLCGASIQKFKATRQSGSNGTIDVIFYRRN